MTWWKLTYFESLVCCTIECTVFKWRWCNFNPLVGGRSYFSKISKSIFRTFIPSNFQLRFFFQDDDVIAKEGNVNQLNSVANKENDARRSKLEDSDIAAAASATSDSSSDPNRSRLAPPQPPKLHRPFEISPASLGGLGREDNKNGSQDQIRKGS